MQALCRALFVAVIAMVVAAAQPVMPITRCEDVAKLDVRNQTIRTAQRTFAFHDGIAVNYDSPPEQDAKHSQPDWKATIEMDRVIEPAPNVAVRFLLIHDSHETGSGWRYYATGVRCLGGEMREVFHRDGLSLRVDRLDSTVIRVGANYVWDRNASKYVLSK